MVGCEDGIFVAGKTVSKMTYNVLDGTYNSTDSYFSFCCIVSADFIFLIALTSTVLVVSEVRKLMSHLVVRKRSSADMSPGYHSVEDYV